MEAYFNVDENKRHLSINISGCKSVLQSKSNDESLANFAWWEPWHGKFGFSYPWEKYLKIGEQLRELASIILPLHACITSPLQASTTLQQPIKETCKNVGLSLGLTMRELGESILKMRRGQEKVIKIPELHSFKVELTVLSTSELQATENVEALAIANILFLLMEMVDKVKVLAKEVEELGEIAGFESK
ncbi:putative aluminum-activated malate transporter [Helianthus anomalus]